jgi:hypothetical protein
VSLDVVLWDVLAVGGPEADSSLSLVVSPLGRRHQPSPVSQPLKVGRNEDVLEEEGASPVPHIESANDCIFVVSQKERELLHIGDTRCLDIELINKHLKLMQIALSCSP